MRLPPPDRPEADVVRQRLHSLEGALDWPAAADVARPWVEAVRAHPAPFWALESLLQEFPISSQEGLALMRLAEALLRVPDADTAIALTADQLGRADFAGHADSAMGRLSHAAVALSRRFLPDADGATGLSARLGGGLGARAVVTAAVRAVQLEAAAAEAEIKSLRRERAGSPAGAYDDFGGDDFGGYDDELMEV